jgi:protein-S-isoprenylcysteine O-methyltransferase Ste14
MPGTPATIAGAQPSAKPRRSLLGRLLIASCVNLAAAIAILFLTAGAWSYWQGWAFLCVLFLPFLCASCYFYRVAPQFLESRLQRGEKVGEQKQIIRWATPLFLIASLLPGFDHRFGWSQRLHLAVPLWLTIVSLAMALAGILLVLWVMNINRFAARTIQVVAGQTVISTGPYRFVRHPLYSGSALLWIFTPLALGSAVSLPAFVLLVSFYVIRLLSEEKILRKDLPGYADYCARTHYHLIPFVW